MGSPSGLILQGLNINGQPPIPDPTIQAPTGVGDQATTYALEASNATAADVMDALAGTDMVSINTIPTDITAQPPDTIVF